MSGNSSMIPGYERLGEINRHKTDTSGVSQYFRSTERFLSSRDFPNSTSNQPKTVTHSAAEGNSGLGSYFSWRSSISVGSAESPLPLRATFEQRSRPLSSPRLPLDEEAIGRKAEHCADIRDPGALGRAEAGERTALFDDAGIGLSGGAVLNIN